MTADRDALYYPFHLCSEDTLMELLHRFRTVHFRDYMALQLTPFLGTTAFQDRMGDSFPQLVAEGRLVQGYPTSGPLDDDMENAVDQDLADPVWRNLFHHSFREYRRFQRGLFDPSHGIAIGRTMVPGPAALLQLMDPMRAASAMTVESVRSWSAGGKGASRRAQGGAGEKDEGASRRAQGGAGETNACMPECYKFEYGLALIKTAVSNLWTVRIGCSRDLTVATESVGHYDLLQRTLHRSGVKLANHLLAKTDHPTPT
jgi:hypothetical protein